MCFFAFHIKQGNIQMHYKLVTNLMAKLLQMLRNCQFTRIQMEDWQNTMETHLLLVPYHHSIITRHSFLKIISS